MSIITKVLLLYKKETPLSTVFCHSRRIIKFFYGKKRSRTDGCDKSALFCIQYAMIIDTYARVHFIGIGGISLSSLALFLVKNGVAVSGSDRCFSDKLTLLSENGCRVWVGSAPDKIKSPDLVIYSSAVPQCDEELAYCRSHGYACKERKDFLGELCDDFLYCIAIGGTHGKTTVTAMLIKIFADAKMKFFGHVGGDTVDNNGCVFSGYDYFITEACEYRKSLLALNPKISVVLNAEADHPDTYDSIEDIYDVFRRFLNMAISNKGLAITCGDEVFFNSVSDIDGIITYGVGEKNRFRATNIYEYKNGFWGFLICDYGIPIGNIKLPIPGEHNIKNALCAFCTAYASGIPCDGISRSINTFGGVKRRFQRVCKYLGADVFTDYAHHPAEIAATLDTAKRIAKGRLIAVFQPHTYSRTQKLFVEFLQCFDKANSLIILKEYPARETPDKGKSARQLCDALRHPDKRYAADILEAMDIISEKTEPDDLIMIIGAGDVINLCALLDTD